MATRPNGRLNVLKSLTGKQMVDPSGNDWYTQFLATMSQKVGEAQVAASAAEKSAQDAKNAVASVDEKLAQFYKKDEVDGFVTMLRGEIAAVDGLANFNVQYDNDTRTLTFLNGAEEITKIKLNTDPSAEWVSMYNGIVDNKISTAVTPVQTELTEYKTANDAAVQELKNSVGDLPETLKSSYYNKEATDALLDKKADKTTVDVLSSDVSGLKNTVGGIQTSVDLANADIAKIQETLKDFKPDENSGREYDITYEDSKLNLLENGTVKTTVIIEGGGGGGGNTSTITIERIGDPLSLLSRAIPQLSSSTLLLWITLAKTRAMLPAYGMLATQRSLLRLFIKAKTASTSLSTCTMAIIRSNCRSLTPWAAWVQRLGISILSNFIWRVSSMILWFIVVKLLSALLHTEISIRTFPLLWMAKSLVVLQLRLPADR